MDRVALFRKHIFPEGIAVLYNIMAKKLCILECTEEQIPVFGIRKVIRMEQSRASAVDDPDPSVSPEGFHLQKTQIGIQLVVYKQVFHFLCAHRQRLDPFSKCQNIRILILPQKKNSVFTPHQGQKILGYLLHPLLAGSVQEAAFTRKQQHIICIG